MFGLHETEQASRLACAVGVFLTNALQRSHWRQDKFALDYRKSLPSGLAAGVAVGAGLLRL